MCVHSCGDGRDLISSRKYDTENCANNQRPKQGGSAHRCSGHDIWLLVCSATYGIHVLPSDLHSRHRHGTARRSPTGERLPLVRLPRQRRQADGRRRLAIDAPGRRASAHSARRWRAQGARPRARVCGCWRWQPPRSWRSAPGRSAARRRLSHTATPATAAARGPASVLQLAARHKVVGIGD